jgi:diguanylate cyclase (GGDEF)-like protein
MKNGRNHIVVDGEKCIHCGHCVTLCRHFAREFIDDTDTFFEDLANGIPISIAVDPAFYLDYPDTAQLVLAHLKKLGVKKIYNESVGGDIATWAYCKWLTEHPDEGGITESCVAVIEYLERQHPEYLDKMIPVKPPLMCLATYVRKYLGESDNIAYLSSCITAKDLIDSPHFKGSVQYNVTFAHLFMHLNMMEIEGKKNKKLEEVKPDLPDYGLGSLFPIAGGLRQNLTHFLGVERPIINLSNVIYMYPMLDQYDEVIHDRNNPLIVESLNCEHGCIFGSGIDGTRFDMKVSLEQYNKKRLAICGTKKDPTNPYCRFMQSDKRISVLNEHFAELHIEDFYFKYTENYEQPFEIPADICEETYLRLHKTTPESRHIDCGGCGYNTCRKMVEAIASGYNQVTNCANYERFENRKLITTNPVTGIQNTGMFHQKLMQMIAKKTLVGNSILYFNIRNFMLVNKRFGFNKGSAVLREFASGASALLEEGESIFHAGGDTFFVVVKNERVNKVFYELNHLELPTLSVEDKEFPLLTIRCGVYQLSGAEKELENIVNPLNAVFMLAKRKQNSDIVFYNKTVASGIVNSLLIVQQLPAALDNNELFIMYQPKVSVVDHILRGAEALIRWNNNGTIVSPGEFVPECEANGFIKRIDFYVLNQVCKTCADWISRGITPVRISVNFSKLHFNDANVAEEICNILDSWKVPHKYLEIEFTETSFVDEKENLKTTIDKLKNTEILCAIDDFGTGYSSFSLLHELNFSILKFDKTFIDTVEHNTRAETIVNNVVHMAKDLHMEVVAEGVETRDKLGLVSLLGSDLVQGYIFDKPLVASEFEKRLVNKKYN